MENCPKRQKKTVANKPRSKPNSYIHIWTKRQKPRSSYYMQLQSLFSLHAYWLPPFLPKIYLKQAYHRASASSIPIPGDLDMCSNVQTKVTKKKNEQPAHCNMIRGKKPVPKEFFLMQQHQSGSWHYPLWKHKNIWMGGVSIISDST